MDVDLQLRRIRIWLGLFVTGLIVSGVTAFPLVSEVRLVMSVLDAVPAPDAVVAWLTRVHEGLTVTAQRYPFMAYGSDWLAFAHLCIAVAFWGPWRDPVRNVWVVRFGLIACAGIVPLALICGPLRGIPFWWQLIDISFGVFGAIPLLVVLRRTRALEAATPPSGRAPGAAGPAAASPSARGSSR